MCLKKPKLFFKSNFVFFQMGREKDVDPMLQQQILDQLRRDNENAMESFAKQKTLAMQATKVCS